MTAGAIASWWVDDERTLGQQRELLGPYIVKVLVGRGVRGRNRFDRDRVRIDWWARVDEEAA